MVGFGGDCVCAETHRDSPGAAKRYIRSSPVLLAPDGPVCGNQRASAGEEEHWKLSAREDRCSLSRLSNSRRFLSSDLPDQADKNGLNVRPAQSQIRTHEAPPAAFTCSCGNGRFRVPTLHG